MGIDCRGLSHFVSGIAEPEIEMASLSLGGRRADVPGVPNETAETAITKDGDGDEEEDGAERA